jgi:hypothetical protein
MRIESLDLDQPVDAQAELDELATRLRAEGWAVEVSGIDEPHLARFLESAEHELVTVLNVVLDEAERLAIDAAILGVLGWARRRRHFRGREGAKPAVVIWIVEEDVRTVELPDPDDDQS